MFRHAAERYRPMLLAATDDEDLLFLEHQDLQGQTGVEGRAIVLLDLQPVVGERLTARVDLTAHLPQLGRRERSGPLVELAQGAPDA